MGEPGRAERRGECEQRAGRLAAFTALFAAALVLDQVWWGGFEVRPLHGLVVLAAFWVLTRPGALGRFAVLLAVTAVSVASDLPSVGSHRVVELVVAVALLGYLGIGSVRVRGRPTPAERDGGVAGFLRAVVVVVYLASSLAKLNSSFLEPASSCATAMALPLVGPGLVPAAIVGTVVVEAGLPVLLLVRRTRLVGIVLGTGFHVVLAFAGNVPFSAVMLALYVGFLPADTVARLPGAGRRLRWPLGAQLGLLAVLCGGWLAAATVGPADAAPGLTAPPSALVSPVTGEVALVVYLGLAVGGVALVLVSRWRARVGVPGPTGPEPRGRAVPVAGRLVLVVAVGVLVGDALCPYVGLKTDTSFEMFSGLRTEPGAWNHLVVGEAVRVFDAQEPVEVVGASDPALVARTGGGRRIVLTELDRALRAEPGATAVYRTADDSTPRTLGPLPASRTVGEWVASFRDLPPPGVPRC